MQNVISIPSNITIGMAALNNITTGNLSTSIGASALTGPLSSPMNLLQSNNHLTTSGKRRGWPLKHSRRVFFYHANIRRMHYSVKCMLLNNKVSPILSDYEVEEFTKIKSSLAALYNNRYEEYYKMMCDEREVEYHPRGIVNKYVLE